MKAKIHLGETDDIYARLNKSETDSNWSNAKDSEEESQEDEQYNEVDFKYGLVDDRNEKKMPSRRPFKGYRYMSFTIFMIVLLLIMVVYNL